MNFNLDQAEYTRKQAFIRMTVYGNKISQLFNSQVKSRSFNLKDLVLKISDVLGGMLGLVSWGRAGRDPTKVS